MDTLSEIPTSDLARELARRRRREVRACPRCGAEFLAYPTQKWCSRRCADAQHYQANRESRDAARKRYPRKPHPRLQPS